MKKRAGEKGAGNSLCEAATGEVTIPIPDDFPTADVLEFYRLRWQIELVFKRLKSLLHLDQLPAKDPDLARCWIYAKIIAALLLEDMSGHVIDSPPRAAHRRAAADLTMAHPAHAV